MRLYHTYYRYSYLHKRNLKVSIMSHYILCELINCSNQVQFLERMHIYNIDTSLIVCRVGNFKNAILIAGFAEDH